MAKRLIDAGYSVIGFDVAGTDERLPAGARAASSIADLARQVTILCLSVPDGTASLRICQEIVEADDRLLQSVIDLSTIGIEKARACSDVLRSHGVTYIDAPVSGGVAGAHNGTLAMMVGAPAEQFAAVEDLLSVFASKRFRVGDVPGQGQVMKLLNNYVSGAALAATCEATVYGARQGLDLAMMVEVLNASSGRSAASEDKFPRSVVTGTYDFGFAAGLIAKDVTLYLESAKAIDVSYEVATAVVGIWQRFASIDPAEDFTALHRYLQHGGT